MNLLHPPLLDALARDYATGTLSGGARRRFERLLRDSAAARFATATWQERLTVLAAGVPPMVPRPQVWQELQRRAFGTPRAAPAPWWRALLAGRWLRPGLGGALAGVLLAVVVLRLQPAWVGHEELREALPESYVGLLADAAGKPSLLASSRRHGRQLTVKMLQPLAVPPGKVAQLWALPKGGAAPFPVGVVPARGSATLALPDRAEKLFFGVDRLGVSFEDRSGASAPSSPYVLTGACVKLW